MHGHRGAGNIKLELRWNAEFYNRITIIFGLIKQGQNYSIPVYRMRTEDDGELIIPGRLLNRLPLENFSKMVITFVRAFEKSEGTPNNSLFVSTQSIHSIILDIP